MDTSSKNSFVEKTLAVRLQRMDKADIEKWTSNKYPLKSHCSEVLRKTTEKVQRSTRLNKHTSSSYKPEVTSSPSVLRTAAKSSKTPVVHLERIEDLNAKELYSLLQDSKNCSPKPAPIKNRNKRREGTLKALLNSPRDVEECVQAESTHQQESGQNKSARVQISQSDSKTSKKCGFCEKTFAGRITFDNHMRKHTGEKPFSCFKCETSFSYVHLLCNHVKKMHNFDEAHFCIECDEIFLDNESFSYHSQSVHLKIPISCATCGKICKSNFLLNQHQKVHILERPFSCPKCDATFKCKNSAKTHIQSVHSTQRPFQCKICHMCFKDNAALKQHTKRHTTERKHKCEYCQKVFLTLPDLEAHIRIHTGEKPYSCKECAMAFAVKGNLRKHLRIHGGERNVQCEKCPMKFYTQSVMKIHFLNRHTENRERLFGCDKCGKSFFTKRDFKQHLRIHTGEKIYGCNLCNKRFTNSGNLNIHLRKHNNEKPYLCKICDTGFPSLTQLNYHNETRHSDKVKFYPCDECGKKFSHVSNMRRHKGTVHLKLKKCL